MTVVLSTASLIGVAVTVWAVFNPDWQGQDTEPAALKVPDISGEIYRVRLDSYGCVLREDDRSNQVPPSFGMMLVDQHNAKHFIPLRDGAILPELPSTKSAT